MMPFFHINFCYLFYYSYKIVHIRRALRPNEDEQCKPDKIWVWGIVLLEDF